MANNAFPSYPTYEAALQQRGLQQGIFVSMMCKGARKGQWLQPNELQGLTGVALNGLH